MLCVVIVLQVRAAEMPLGATGAHSWHVLRGFKHSAGRVESSMRASMHILQGSFDPIMDANNNTDLLPLIIQAKVVAWPAGAGRACSCWSYLRVVASIGPRQRAVELCPEETAILQCADRSLLAQRAAFARLAAGYFSANSYTSI